MIWNNESNLTSERGINPVNLICHKLSVLTPDKEQRATDGQQYLITETYNTVV